MPNSVLSFLFLVWSRSASHSILICYTETQMTRSKIQATKEVKGCFATNVLGDERYNNFNFPPDAFL